MLQSHMRFFLISILWSACFFLFCQSLKLPEINGREISGEEEEVRGHKKLDSTVYIIRHGEKPKDGSRGLSCLGRRRAKCVLELFGPQSDLDINYIIAAPSNHRRRNSRSVDTAKPLAEALNLEIDSHCASTNAKCVAKRVKKIHQAAAKQKATTFNTLIIGRHSKIPKILKQLGVHHPAKFPNVYDIILKVRGGRVEILHQHCPGLDDIKTLPGNANSTIEDEDCDSNEIHDGYAPTQVPFSTESTRENNLDPANDVNEV